MYNPSKLCAPCHSQVLLDSYTSGQVTVSSAVDLASAGIAAYATQLTCSVRDAIVAALDDGLLPDRLRPEVEVLAALCELETLSNSQAARELGVTRFAVASWRQLLGLENPRAAHGQRLALG